MGKDKLFSKDKNFGQADHKHHNHEHDYWSRRSFIQALGLVGGGSIMMGNQAVSAAQATPLTVALSESQNDNILVIIRLNGGNDGLNTIVPVYDYATYANLRPNIRHFEPNLLPLNDDFSIPDYMNDLESVWGDGQMKVVHGVGYPDQNLSHFRSSDIWASAAHQYEEPTGWWGRYFEDLYPDYLTNPPAAPPAIQVGNIGNLIFDGFDNNYAFTV
ncbi:twin-arginine translocation pathway signal, partial [Flavobacteriaceae bacterium]|nr:twin-arginine translocation pathway signal [Flavobacteriaceae bacterium]